MANMGKLTKRQFSARLDIELCVKVEKRYMRRNDNNRVTSYIRALEDATRDVVLTSADYQKIAAEVRANEMKRRTK